ncbi:MAG: phosphotransferase family protein [Pseudomonadota bacterium]|nr:phosphotransferase family protein [Pseudomonadota bacterium]
MPNDMTPQDLRDCPSDAFIAQMREAYPVEPEMDRVLTRKMQSRQSATFGDFTIDHLIGCLKAMLSDKLDGAFTVHDPHWLAGGASKLQVVFDLDWDDPEQGRTTTRMVARMEPAESLNATSRPREFQLINAFKGVLPVPRVFWLDDSATWFPQETIVYEFLKGVTRPSAEASRVSGLGQTFGPEVRAALGPQFVESLARIHTRDFAGADLSAFHVPAVGTTETAMLQLNRARRVWDEDRGHDLPLFDLAAEWLSDHLPDLDVPSLLHGDFRPGNFLFDESTMQITAWLDWERGYIGDRHRDLAWTSTSTFGSFAEDGTTFLVSGLIPEDEFFARYKAASGLSVDPKKLRFYKALNSFQLMVSALGTAYRLVRLGKTHQDVLLAWVEGVGYAQAEELRRAMLEDL